jgi:hypothetical protein
MVKDAPRKQANVKQKIQRETQGQMEGRCRYVDIRKMGIVSWRQVARDGHEWRRVTCHSWILAPHNNNKKIIGCI